MGKSVIQYLFVVFIIIGIESAAQVNNDSLTIIEHLNQGKINLSKSLVDSAFISYSNALELQKILLGKNHLNVASTHFQLGRIEWMRSNYDQALQYFQSALAIRKDQLEEIHIDIAKTYNALGITSWSRGLHEDAIDYYTISLDILKKLLGSDHHQVGAVLHNIGILLMETGAYEEALDYVQNSLFLKKHNIEQGSSRLAEAEGLHLISIIYRKMANNELALKYGKSAIEVLLAEERINDQGLADFKLSIGMTYLELGEMEKAKKYFNESLITYLDLYGKEHSGTAVAYHNLGLASSCIKEKMLYLNRALQTRLKIFSENHRDVLHIYNSIGQAYLENEDNTHALDVFDSALLNNVTKNLGNSNLNAFHMDNFTYPMIALESLLGKIKTLNQTTNKERFEKLKSTLAVIQVADTLIDEIHASYLNYNDKIFLSKIRSEVYSYAIQTSLSLSEYDTLYKDFTFYFLEKNKSRILQEISNSNSAKRLKLIPDSLLSVEKNLKIDISLCKSRLLQIEEESEDLKGNLRKELFELQREYNSLINSIEKIYPKYYHLKYSNKIATITDVQNEILNKNQVLIEYFEADSSIFIFAITKTSFDVKIHPKDSSYQVHLFNYRKALDRPNLIDHSKSDFNTYTEAAYELYNYLIDPIDSLISTKELIIIPNGKLALVPFEAFLTRSVYKDEMNYQALPYLLNSYAISYANSATLLLNELKYPKISVEEDGPKILAFAPEFKKVEFSNELDSGSVRNQLGSLYWTEEEITALSSYFDTKIYLGSKATEKRFKEDAEHYDIIHIASHGLIDDQNSMNSKIVFTEYSSDTLNDGYLHTFELYNSHLDADMAVLSACNTGYGEIVKSEGVLNLARGFFYAGCKSVVMSLWVANDKSTATLMSNFYKYLADNENKHKALQKAKLEYLRNNDGIRGHPYYWSQFIISGNTDTLKSNNKISAIKFISFLILTVFIIGAALTNRKRLTNFFKRVQLPSSS